MYNRTFAFLLIITFLIIPVYSLGQDKLVFIDINYVFNNSAAGKKINKKIQEETKKINKELSEYNKKVENEKKTLLTQQNVISKEEFEKKIKKLEDDVRDYRSNINKKNDKLIKFKNQARVEFTNKLNIILTEYSKENSISMILKKENVIIGKTSLDVSSKILELFDERVKKISIN